MVYFKYGSRKNDEQNENLCDKPKTNFGLPKDPLEHQTLQLRNRWRFLFLKVLHNKSIRLTSDLGPPLNVYRRRKQ